MEIKFSHYSARFRETGRGEEVSGLDISVCLFRAQAQEGRPASGSTHLDAKNLPLNTVRAHVNTMTSLRLPFK